MKRPMEGDPEMVAYRRRAEPLPLEGLFAPLDEAITMRPPARVEQGVLPVPGTIAERYARWRETPDGLVAFQAIRELALAAAARGDRRIGVKHLAEDVRAQRRIRINNSVVALIARELKEREPRLRDRIELRERVAT